MRDVKNVKVVASPGEQITGAGDQSVSTVTEAPDCAWLSQRERAARLPRACVQTFTIAIEIELKREE